MLLPLLMHSNLSFFSLVPLENISSAADQWRKVSPSDLFFVLVLISHEKREHGSRAEQEISCKWAEICIRPLRTCEDAHVQMLNIIIRLSQA